MHPLSGTTGITIGKPYAAVEVLRRGKQLIVQPGSVFITKADVKFAELPREFEIVDQEGIPLAASGKFLISVETFDPVHVVIDYRESARE